MAQNDDWWSQDVAAASATADPQRRKAEADIAQSGASAAASGASAERTRTLLPSEARASMATALKAEAEAAKAQRETEQAGKAEQVTKLTKVQDVGNLLGNIQQARENVGFWSMGLPGQMTQGLWGGPAANLKASLRGVKAPIVLEKLREAKAQSATGASGFGALSERELGLLESAIGSLDQSQSPEQLQANLDRVEVHFRRAQAYINGVDPDTPEGRFAAGLAAPAGEQPPAGGGEAKAGRLESKPELAGVNATVTEMVKAGRTADQIKAWLNSVQSGLGDRTRGVEETINFYKQRGGEPVVNIEQQFVPAEGAGRAAVEMMQTAPGAAAAGFTSGMTSGFMDELTGNQPRAQAAMRYAEEQSPVAYTLGEIGGQAAQFGLGAKGLGALMSRYGLEALPTLGNIAQSAAYGAGTAQPGERLGGAVSGGITGLIGTKAAEAATKTAGRLIGGAGSDAARELSALGVPMTAGQIMGGGIKRAEDRATSLPIVGDTITARRKESLAGFNKAAFDEALAPLGASVDDIGVPGVAKAQQAVNEAYSAALNNLRLAPDQPFLDNVFSNALPKVQKIPRVGDEIAGQVNDILSTHIDPATGEMTGEAFQIAMRELRDLRGSYKTDPQFGSRIAPRLAAIEDELGDLIQRQAPDRAAIFGNANEAYKRVEIIGDAVDFAPAASGGVFTPDQLYRKSREVTRRFSGKRASRRGAKPFAELTAAGRTELPAQVPDSGTAGRMLMPALAASALGGGTFAAGEAAREKSEERDLLSPFTAAATGAALAATPYSRAGQRMLQSALTAQRPMPVEYLGTLLEKYAPYAGAAARPYTSTLGVDEVPSPEVDPYSLRRPGY